MASSLVARPRARGAPGASPPAVGPVDAVVSDSSSSESDSEPEKNSPLDQYEIIKTIGQYFISL